jgi:heat shock protein HslJ
MEQEAAFLTALPTAARYEVVGPNLSLLTAEATIVATFTRAPEQ